MRSWIASVLGVTGVLAVALFVSSHRDKAKAPAVAAVSETNADDAELRREIAALKKRVGLNEGVVRLALAANEGAREAPGESQGGEADDESTAAAPADVAANPPPTVEQHMARFHQHFTTLDGLRGARSDGQLERKFRELLTSPEAARLPALSQAKIDRVDCGNEFCRVQVSFHDHTAARLGQSEIQIQVGPLSRGATMYVEPNGSRVHAYFATGKATLPPFPDSEVVPLQDG